MVLAPIHESLPGPISPSDRIESIDALRGVALLGVLAINLVTEFRVSIFQQFLPAKQPASSLDRAVETVLMLAVDMKAFALFSLLFGVGLAIQFEHLAANSRRVLLLFRRVLVLLIFGLIHLCLIWNGDILTEYAIAGLVVLPFLFGPRWLLLAGAAAFLGLYLTMQVWSPPGLFPSLASIQGIVEEANRVYATGNFGEVLAFRLREIALILPLHIYVFPRTLGLFLLGAFVWRSGVLQKPNHILLFTAGAGCVGLGAAIILLRAGNAMAGTSFGVLATPAGTILLALGYGAIIIAIASSARGKALLGWAAPLGRMAFTNYLAQSVIFGWIFYGYGLGLFGLLGAAEALAIGLVVYVAQVIFSGWWLGRHRYGPVEWLWRTLMYGTPQPLLGAGLNDSGRRAA
ncbi:MULTISPECIES: DUF418 domain-containing protein [unclassified Bradyrhizobium]|uniref:DUF418 domain-containing protein n=1 Tax=unclassified Bradyrhizobium TaxID=2631580 RepID=UPI0015C8AA5F|nr:MULTISPECIES: DUF418 domain-containing protein [unclassified Bradyrhizobium]